MRALMLMLLFGLCVADASADAADSNRIIALEQDVRNLERIVANLERELRQVRYQGSSPALLGSEGSELPRPTSDDWVNAAKWKKIRPGTSEMQVIELLGQPTSMRTEGDTRVLLYAMEIGSAGFLSGSVKLRDREVTEVELPVLK